MAPMRSCGRALALVAVAVTLTLAAETAAAPGAGRAPRFLEEIAEYRKTTWRWEAVMGIERTPSSYAERTASPAYRIWIRDFWRRRAADARRRALRPPHLAAWLCLHRYEGSWRDPAAPYYGGLQMDIGFQRAYGRALLRRKGPAHKWTPLEQMWVAEKALRAGRGFHPWPVAAHRCGLL